MRKHNKKPLPHQHFSINPPKPKIPRLVSWWIDLPRDNFTQRAAQEAFQETTGPLLKTWTDPV